MSQWRKTLLLVQRVALNGVAAIPASRTDTGLTIIRDRSANSWYVQTSKQK